MRTYWTKGGRMGVQPSVNYVRVRAAGNAVLPKLRKITRNEMLHWRDSDLGNILDMAIEAALKDNPPEIWYEDDPAYGICENRVIRIDEYLPGGVDFNVPVIYAIVRKGARGDGVEVIISLVDQECYDKAIMERRWTETKPAKSKYRHPGEPETEEVEKMEIPDSVRVAVAAQQAQQAQPSPPVQVVVRYQTEEQGLQYTTCALDGLNKVVLDLITRGADPNEIYVWKSVSKIRLTITLEDK